MKILFLLLLIPGVILAAEPDQNVKAPSVERVISIWQFMIPILVPAIIALLKAMIPKLPSRLIPFLAPIIGALIDVLLNLGDLGGGFGAIGALFGASGVGVREIVDQTKKTSVTPVPNA